MGIFAIFIIFIIFLILLFTVKSKLSIIKKTLLIILFIIICFIAITFAFIYGFERGSLIKEANEEEISNEIMQISVRTSGGEMGVSDSYIYTKDSIFHDFYLAADTSQNFKNGIANKNTTWQKLVSLVNVREFSKGISGTSNQPVDGTDTTILITTESGAKYKITNGYENQNWKTIYTELNKQQKFLN